LAQEWTRAKRKITDKTRGGNTQEESCKGPSKFLKRAKGQKFSENDVALSLKGDDNQTGEKRERGGGLLEKVVRGKTKS